VWAKQGGNGIGQKEEEVFHQTGFASHFQWLVIENKRLKCSLTGSSIAFYNLVKLAFSWKR